MVDVPRRIPHVVITGAPMTGKTTVADALRSRDDLLVIEEAATWLLEHEYPPISTDNPWSYEWQVGLVQRVIARAKQREDEAQEIALTQGKKVILHDRGILDTVPFLKGDIEEFDTLSPIKHVEVLARYDTVIYLGWLGSARLDASNNTIRFQDIEQAKQLIEPSRRAYIDHPRFVEVHSIEERLSDVEIIVDNVIHHAS
jgi:predicted ATPase